MDRERVVVVSHDVFRSLRKLEPEELVVAMRAYEADMVVSADDPTLRIVV